MTLSISPTSAGAVRAAVAAVPQAMRDEVKALGKALRSGDLAGARAAYVGIAKQAPDGATLQPGSPFAQLGKALKAGDMEAAKASFVEAARARIHQPDSGVGPMPPPESTDAGNRALHVVA